MSLIKSFSKATAALAAFAFALAMTGAVTFAASDFVGKWKTTDSQGKPFTIWLSDDGKAKGDLARNNKGLAGMWKEEGNSAVITWDSGWTSTITKEGNSYKKAATENGKPAGKPAEAQKVE
jgi:hypothetical protein